MIEFKRLIEDQELGQLYLYFLTKMNQSDTVEDNRGEPFVLPAGCFVSNYSNIAHELKSTRKKVTPRIEMLREMGLIALNNFPKPGDTFRARLRDESGHTLDKVFIVLNHTLNVLETQKRAQLEAQVQAHVLVQLEKTEEKIVLDSPPKPENSLPHTPSLNNSSKILNIAPPIERNEIESESKAFAQSAEPIVAAGSFFSEEDHSEEVNVLAGGKDKLEPQLEIQGLTQEPVVDTKPVKEITPEQKRNIAQLDGRGTTVIFGQRKFVELLECFGQASTNGIGDELLAILPINGQKFAQFVRTRNDVRNKLPKKRLVRRMACHFAHEQKRHMPQMHGVACFIRTCCNEFRAAFRDQITDTLRDRNTRLVKLTLPQHARHDRATKLLFGVNAYS